MRPAAYTLNAARPHLLLVLYIYIFILDLIKCHINIQSSNCVTTPFLEMKGFTVKMNQLLPITSFV